MFLCAQVQLVNAAQLLKSSDPAPQFAATLIQAFIERLHISPITLGDYGAVACVIHPELLQPKSSMLWLTRHKDLHVVKLSVIAEHHF